LAAYTYAIVVEPINLFLGKGAHQNITKAVQGADWQFDTYLLG
jgi:hypothetical protein